MSGGNKGKAASEKKPKLNWEKLLGYRSGDKLTDTPSRLDKIPTDEPDRSNEKLIDLKEILGDKADHFPISPFDRDYERIVSSADFRALQDKTQVFPLSKSDFIRTRLTHSNEVSTIARQLGVMCFQNTSENPDMRIAGDDIDKYPDSQQYKNDIERILACAGLLHDIGNPPFGHKGEDDIRDWFNEHLVFDAPEALTYVNGDDFHIVAEEMGLKKDVKESKEPEMILDLKHFEGNSQAIRILCKARYGSGVAVSDAVIASIIKYPTTSNAYVEALEKANGNKNEIEDLRRHKNGYYHSEKKYVEEIARKLGLSDGEEKGELNIHRHPLAYLLEAADDIAYLTADLEDAVKVKIINPYELYYFLISCLHDAYEKTPDESSLYFAFLAIKKLGEILGKKELIKEDDNEGIEEVIKKWNPKNNVAITPIELNSYPTEKINKWGTYLRVWMMYVACYIFNKNYTDGIMEGDFNYELLKNPKSYYNTMSQLLRDAMGKPVEPMGNAVKTMKNAVYDDPIIESKNRVGKETLKYLLDNFVPAAINHNMKADQTETGELVYNLIPKSFKDDYEQEIQEIGHEAPDNDEAPDNEKLYHSILMVTDYICSMTDNFANDLAEQIKFLIGIYNTEINEEEAEEVVNDEEAEEDEVEYAEGTWNGENIIFKRVWSGYRFSDEEVQKLLDDEAIELHDVIGKDGNPFSCIGHLDEDTNKGKVKFTRIAYLNVDQNGDVRCKGTWNGKEISFNRVWGDHEFSPDECEKLLNGEEISFEATSKKGANYTANGKLEDLISDKGNKYVGFNNQY